MCSSDLKKKRTFGVTERAEDGFVTETVLAALHNQGQPVVYVLVSLLLLIVF